MDDSAPRLGVDVGGTFTDVVLVADGDVTTAKVPTTADQSEGVIRGIERACEAAGVDPASLASVRHATTVATNAMLEGTGATTALLTTEGFGDLLEIGRQDRPALYDLSASKPDPLVPARRRQEVEERATTGGIEREVRDGDLAEIAAELDPDVESIAVSFLHAYDHPSNERRTAQFLRRETEANVVASHEILPEFREYERTATTVADAVVTPVVGDYLDRLERKASVLGVPNPEVMQSNGGISHVGEIKNRGVSTLLSGPAAGVVGAALFDSDSHEGTISFDMGGTSSDVSLVRDGEVDRTAEATVGGYPVHVPMVDVETIGAGGGSIAWLDEGGALRVGPRSAGAEPGPACYGRGGDRPTVTDACLLLGYIGPDASLGEGLELEDDRARAVFESLAADTSLGSAIEVARGTYRIATERMARAVRAVTVQEGHDPREFALVAFGGAGPMFACSLAERIGVNTVRVPRANGVLSALGLLAAPERQDVSRTVHRPLAALDAGTVEDLFRALLDRVDDRIRDVRLADVQRRADLRYRGQSHELTVDVDVPFDHDGTAARFHAAHERSRGYRLEDEPIQVVTLRVTATIPGSEPALSHEGETADPRCNREAHFDDGARETTVYDRDRIPADESLSGAAILEGGESTIVVPPSWRAEVDERGTLSITRSTGSSGGESA